MATCNFDPSPGRDRFIRFTRLLIVGGTPILRDVLKLFHTPTTLAAALVGTRIRFTKPQKQLLGIFPPSGLLPNFEDFDISLIFKLLRNCCGLTEPVTRWNELPVEGDVSLAADVVRIDFYRNDIYAHILEHMAITHEDFNKYWDIISDALCRVAIYLTGSATALQNEIQVLRFSPLTSDDHRMVEEHLRNIESSLAEQDKKLDNIVAKEDQIKQGIEGIQDTIINAFQCTKISDDKTLAAAAPVQYNFTYNNFNPANLVVSSEYTHVPPPGLTQGITRPGLTQGITRQVSEGTITQKKPQRPYHKSYSQPSNVGHRKLSSQERCANPEEFQFPVQNPQADEYQLSNPAWQSPNQTAHNASFYVDQDDSPDPLANEAAAVRTLTTNPSYHTSSRDDMQTSSATTTWNSPSNHGFSSGPYHASSRDDRQTSSAATTWNSPSNQGFSRRPHHTSSRDDRQTSPINPLVSNKNGWLRQQQEDQDPLLHINISVRGAGSLDFHLGNVVKSELADMSQFTSYLEKHQLIIKKIEGNVNGDSCFIGVSPRDLDSLAGLWHDYIVQDLREFVKETVLPEDFRGEVDVNIDGEEYKRCCESLRPRVFKDSGRQLHSQSFSQVRMACDVTKPSEPIPRSQSVMDLPSTLKNASQELLQLICKHGGRMDWQMAKQQLSYASYTELTKPAFKQNMSRYLEFLPNNDVQVKLRFCPKMRKDSTCSNTNCPDLHLCRYYFLPGRCKFPTNCKNSHNISDDHTNNVFKMANISFLNDEERKRLLRNVAYVAPEVCFYYNNPSNSCTKDSKCAYLHVCMNWVLVGRGCAAGTWCKRAHTFRNPHEQQILKKNNLDQMSEKKILEKLNEHYS